MNRRELMASGIAATLVARGSAAAVSVAAPAAAGARRPLFLADQRFGDAQVATVAAEAAGAPIHRFGADVTPVYEWLDLRLRSGPAPVAGIATPHALFVLERLAWDRGLRTVFRGVHRDVSSRHLTHECSGAPAVVARIESAGRENWAATVGRVLATVPALTDDSGRNVVTSPHLPRNDEKDTLVSWLLIPRRSPVEVA